MALAHIVDGRLHVIDGRRMRYLSAMSTALRARSRSPDRRALRGQHLLPAPAPRRRSDVVEVYGTDDLVLRHEIEIPPKHAQAMNIRASRPPAPTGAGCWCKTPPRPAASPWST
jgi:methylamine dehydrogenase heavy chain